MKLNALKKNIYPEYMVCKSDLYKDSFSFIFQYGYSLIEWLQQKSDEKYLDLGCGTGELIAKLKAPMESIGRIGQRYLLLIESTKKSPKIDFIVPQRHVLFIFHII